MTRPEPKPGTADTNPRATAAPALPPLLKWLGGKRWLAPDIAALYAGHRQRRLVEPFCGGLAVALGLRPREALLNDANPHLINFYTWIQRGLIIRIALENDAATYYNHRTRFNDLIARGRSGDPEAAMLFYYLNRHGFNGLCRFNRRGDFNVPFGRYRRTRCATRFEAHRQQLASWRFQSRDFARLRLRPSDFVYADPPYDDAFTQYGAESFSWDDQVRLAHWLARHPGPVVLSNHDTDRVRTLYQDLGFRIVQLHAPRRISANGDRTPARELLALRNV
ncbi:MAG: Dam family site-specific DNA-(adenine-N6)-methyltransferase [Candidatus Hydrogenedentes bacterium]|nr:Dam family site-specific DNA-(adenine-N6)-methyltransferase [Candidatus Hydrogenedentota bacterium]